MSRALSLLLSNALAGRFYRSARKLRVPLESASPMLEDEQISLT
jgi:hypothetical protein